MLVLDIEAGPATAVFVPSETDERELKRNQHTIRTRTIVQAPQRDIPATQVTLSLGLSQAEFVSDALNALEEIEVAVCKGMEMPPDDVDG